MPTDNIKRLRELGAHLVDPEIATLIFEEIPDAIFMVDSEASIQLLNKQAELLFGYHRTELFDKQIHVLVPESVRERHFKHVERFFSDPRVRPMGADLNLKALHKNGQEFEVEINLSPLVTPQGIFALAVVRKKRE